MAEDYSLSIGNVSQAKLTDRSWMANNFALPQDLFTDNGRDISTLLHYSSAMSKVWDTTIGGHIAINIPPQNNPLADIRASIVPPGMVSAGEHTTGMGRFFSENIEDNMETITFSFGHLRYQGIIPFFTKFYDAEMATLSKTGHGPGFLFRIGQAVGVVAQVAGLFLSGAMAMVVMGGFLMRNFLLRPSSGYWYIKPSPWAYWRRAQFICNQLAVYMKIVPLRGQVEGITSAAEFDESQAGDTKEFLKEAHGLYPSIFQENGRFDIMALATRPTQIDVMRRNLLREQLNGIDSKRAMTAAKAMIGARYTKVETLTMEDYTDLYFSSHFGNAEYVQYDPFEASVADAGNAAAATGFGTPPPVDTQTDTAMAQDSVEATDSAKNYLSLKLTPNMRQFWTRNEEGNLEQNESNDKGSGLFGLGKSWADDPGMKRYILATANKGADFVTFKVEPTGQVNASFTNTLGEPEIASKINSTSSSAASARFSFSGGNVGSEMVSAVMGGLGDLVKGTLHGLSMDGLLALAGSAQVDIPKHFQNSSADFQTHNYNIELRSPYGDRMSQYLNLYVPIAMLLAAALPLSTGLQSYTAPFYCSLFSKGRCFVRNGMITSLSITRGVGNQGWNKRFEPLGFDISIGITDASNVLHAPIDPGLNLFKGAMAQWDDDSAFKNFMSSLASMNLVDQTDPVRKAAIGLAKFNLEAETLVSSSNIGMWVGDSTIPRLLATGHRILAGAPSEVTMRGGLSPRSIINGAK